MAVSGEPLLELEGVSKSFGAVQALAGVSFRLEAGEVHALLGENGAGKSTLIKVVTGAHVPDAGVVRIGGCEVAGLTPGQAHRLGVACIYQQPALFRQLTVAENLDLGLERPTPFRRVRRERQRLRAVELLARVGAELSPEAEVGALSMPEQQLVEIAKALGSGARILLMDEPTACLGARDVERLLGTVQDLRAHGVGVLYITHRLEEVTAVADRVTILRDGRSLGTRRVPREEAGAAGSGWGVGESDPRVEERREWIRLMVGRDSVEVGDGQRLEGRTRGGATVVELEDVGCVAGGVKGVSLAIRAGEILGMAGLVGAGRTELARVLFGITPADSGRILVHGRACRIRSPREAMACGIGYVPEDRRRHGVILEMPVVQNIVMAALGKLHPRGWLSAARERGVAERFIRALGIKVEDGGVLAGALSGGNQQKVSLARWLAVEPSVLILDEPTQGVDVGAKAEIHRWVRRLAENGLAVVMISSDMAEVVGLSDRVAVMGRGTLAGVLEGAGVTPEAILGLAMSMGEGVGMGAGAGAGGRR